MTTYIIGRIALIFPVMFVIGVVTFTLVHLTPGDPAAVILGPEASAEQVEQLRQELGLDDPFYVQFFTWLGNVLRLDLGDSLFLNMSVTDALMDRAQPTILLTFYSMVLAILIGIPSGVISAVKQNSILDRLFMVLAISGAAIPSFVLGILLIIVFAVELKWLPAGQYTNIQTDPVDHLRHMLLPSIALGVSSAGLLARLVRSSMLDVLHQDFVRTAMAKGLRYRRVVVGHALRNALLPAVTVLGYLMGTLLGGAVVTETVFSLPGMGRLVVQSVTRRDFPIIQGAVIVIAGFYVLVNLLVDILYVYIDPRIRYGDE